MVTLYLVLDERVALRVNIDCIYSNRPKQNLDYVRNIIYKNIFIYLDAGESGMCQREERILLFCLNVSQSSDFCSYTQLSAALPFVSKLASSVFCVCLCVCLLSIEIIILGIWNTTRL